MNAHNAPVGATPETRRSAESVAVWQRCWCYQTGRCLVDCPTADLPHPNPMTDDNWRRAYAEVMERTNGR